MTKIYNVVIVGKNDNLPTIVLLRDYDEVVKIVQNLDTDLYRLSSVNFISEPVFYDITPFVKKEDNIEVGQ